MYTTKLIHNGVEYEFGESSKWRPGANTIAYYKFDGNLNDSSGNGRNLSMYTGSFSYSALSTGQKYCQLNTSAQAIYNNFPFNRAAYTVSGWCYFNDVANYYQQIIFDIPTNTNYRPRFWTGGYSHYNKIGSVVAFDSYNISCENNKWYHLVATYSNNVVSSYVNGQLIHSKTYSNSDTSGSLNLNGTTNSNSSYRTGGRVSELIIESSGWTSQEIADYYNQTKSNYGIS